MDRPNVIVMICHDIGQHLGCYGVETVNTPSLDGLAEEGVRFSNNFCTSPSCSPSRAAIFTGRYPHSNGVMGLCHADFGWDLYTGENHLAGLLHGAGYRTGLLGHQHETRRPHEMGYDDVRMGGHCGEVAEKAIPWLEDAVAGEQQTALPGIEQGNGKHAVEMVKRLVPVFFVRAKHHLGVAECVE